MASSAHGGPAAGARAGRISAATARRLQQKADPPAANPPSALAARFMRHRPATIQTLSEEEPSHAAAAASRTPKSPVSPASAQSAWSQAVQSSMRLVPREATTLSSSPVAARMARSAAAENDALGAKVQLFLDAHPGFAAEVWQAGPGSYVVRGRHVTRLTGGGADRTGQEMVVGVDGWQRPLADVLEDLWHESKLERLGHSGKTSRRFLAETLDEEAERSQAALLRSTFGALRDHARRCTEAINRAARVVLQRFWLAWVCGVWVSLWEQRGLSRLRCVEALVGLHWRCTVAGVIFKEWCIALQSCRTAAAYQRLARARLSMTRVSERSFGESDMDAAAICFLYWRYEKEGRRRRSADAFLMGEAHNVERHSAMLENYVSAQRLAAKGAAFGPALDGPEAQLTRLACAVDGLMARLDPKTWAPTLLPAVQRETAARAPEPAKDTMNLCSALARARGASRELQEDIQFVLALRCFSAWIRGANDLRRERGEERLREANEKLARKKEAFGEYTLTYCSRVANLMGNKVKMSFERHAFDAFCMYVGMEKAARGGEGRGRVLQRLRSEDEYETLTARTILLSWSACASRDRRIARQRAALERARSACDLAVRGWTEVGCESFLSSIFHCWARCAQGTAGRRLRRRRLPGRLEQQRSALLAVAFAALAARTRHAVGKAYAAKVAYRAAEFRISGAAALDWTCRWTYAALVAWRVDARACRVFRASEEARARAAAVRAGSLERGLSAVRALDNLEVEMLQRRALNYWWGCTAAARREGERQEGSRAYRAEQRSVSLARQRARAWQLRACDRFGDQLAAPLCMVAFACWALAVREARREHEVATDWFRRQRRLEKEKVSVDQDCSRRLRLQALSLSLIEHNLRLFLTPSFFAWRGFWYSVKQSDQMAGKKFKEERKEYVRLAMTGWRIAVSSCLLRATGYRLGEATVRWSVISYVQTVVIVWRGAAVRRQGTVERRKLTALQAIAPLLLRKPREALQRWRTRTLRTALDKSLLLREVERRAAARDLLALSTRFFGRWAWYARRLRLAGEQQSFGLHRALLVWRFTAVQDKQARRWAQAGGPALGALATGASAAGTGSSAGVGRAGVSVIQAPGLAEPAPGEQELEQLRRVQAQWMFARGHRASAERPGSLQSKSFAAWLLALLDARAAARAASAACAAASLSVRFLSAADVLLAQGARRLSRRMLLAECWSAFRELHRDSRHQTALKTFGSGVRSSHFAVARRLCELAAAASTAALAEVCFRSWTALRLSTLRMYLDDERRSFSTRAMGLSRRLVVMNSGTYGRLTTAGVLIRWRSAAWRGRRLSRLCGRGAESQLRLLLDSNVRECFSRWSRVSWVGRNAGISAALAFIAWSSFHRGCADPSRAQAGGYSPASGKLSSSSFAAAAEAAPASAVPEAPERLGASFSSQEPQRAAPVRRLSGGRLPSSSPSAGPGELRRRATRELSLMVRKRRNAFAEKRLRYAELASSVRWLRQALILYTWHLCVTSSRRLALQRSSFVQWAAPGREVDCLLLHVYYLSWQRMFKLTHPNYHYQHSGPIQRLQPERFKRFPEARLRALSLRVWSDCHAEIMLRTCLSHWIRCVKLQRPSSGISPPTVTRRPSATLSRAVVPASGSSSSSQLATENGLRARANAAALAVSDTHSQVETTLRPRSSSETKAALAARSMHIGKAGSASTRSIGSGETSQQTALTSGGASQSASHVQRARRDEGADDMEDPWEADDAEDEAKGEDWVSQIPMAGSSRQQAPKAPAPRLSHTSLVGRPAGAGRQQHQHLHQSQQQQQQRQLHLQRRSSCPIPRAGAAATPPGSPTQAASRLQGLRERTTSATSAAGSSAPAVGAVRSPRG
eukprot:TRINITY_DN23063_c0_g1_i1.p1 TRINITY_DN23063_c0_g1~~TRINITY_DN23063_c0_g1_i1.p1  ORF type:complete len:1876 (+),score=374.12 TRINITY_DN23063_c0_g1_i1:55-5628(+)